MIKETFKVKELDKNNKYYIKLQSKVKRDSEEVFVQGLLQEKNENYNIINDDVIEFNSPINIFDVIVVKYMEKSK